MHFIHWCLHENLILLNKCLNLFSYSITIHISHLLEPLNAVMLLITILISISFCNIILQSVYPIRVHCAKGGKNVNVVNVIYLCYQYQSK